MSRFCRFWDSVLVGTVHFAMTVSPRYKFDTRRFEFVPGFGWLPSPHCGVLEDLDLVEHLASGFTSLEVFVALAGLVERECLVDCHLERAVTKPLEDISRAVQHFRAIYCVIQQLGPSDVGRLGNKTENGEGRHGTRGVAEGYEDTPPGERVDGDVHGSLADTVDNTLYTLAVCDFHDALRDVHTGVILERGARGLVADDELVNTSGAANSLLALGGGANDLVSLDFGHLGGPLAGTATDTVDEAPFAGLNQVCMRAVDQVVRGHALYNAGSCHVQTALVGHRLQLARGHSCVLGIGLEDRVGYSITDLKAHGLGLRGHSSNDAAALLTTNEGELAFVKAAAVVSVDEVDARKFVLDKHLAIHDNRHRPRSLDLESRGRASLVHHCGLHGRGHIGKGTEGGRSVLHGTAGRRTRQVLWELARR
mmetsp:Transcript_54574/g.45953  ORF Transcript_54574/g.45953 Transcript_54574/m.45953 type:complete len:423 (-) Transcript_54574:26-1294(-)